MYLRTDEEKEASEALCTASRFADDLKRDSYYWRWVIIALHSAVQGWMVLAFRNKNEYAIYSKNCAEKVRAAGEEGTDIPTELRLDSYPKLFDKVKEQLGFAPKGTQEKNIKKLNSIRNNFIHFTPKGWSLEVNGLPQICNDCLALVDFLDQKIFWHDPNYHEQSRLCAHQLKKQMEELTQIYKNA